MAHLLWEVGNGFDRDVGEPPVSVESVPQVRKDPAHPVFFTSNNAYVATSTMPKASWAEPLIMSITPASSQPLAMPIRQAASKTMIILLNRLLTL